MARRTASADAATGRRPPIVHADRAGPVSRSFAAAAEVGWTPFSPPVFVWGAERPTGPQARLLCQSRCVLPIRYGPARVESGFPFQLRRTSPSISIWSIAACTVGIRSRHAAGSVPAAFASARATSLGQTVASLDRAARSVRVRSCAFKAAIVVPPSVRIPACRLAGYSSVPALRLCPNTRGQRAFRERRGPVAYEARPRGWPSAGDSSAGPADPTDISSP